MFEDKFNVIYLVLFISSVIIRKYSERKHGGEGIKARRENLVEIITLSFIGLGMMAPMVFVFTSWIDFYNYYLPEFIRWAGTILFILACWLLCRSHADLKVNFSIILGIKHDHVLIKNGAYKYIRHPLYAAHLLWALAQLLLIPNWIAGPSFLLLSIPLYVYRVPKEEDMMIKKFGEEYLGYMKKTGVIFPKIKMRLLFY